VSRIQLKVIVALTSLVLVVIAIVGVLVENDSTAREFERTRASLIERTRLARVLVSAEDVAASSPEARTQLARRVAEAASARTTLIGRDGRVMADSEVPAADLADAESHLDRPEVRAALDGELGQSTRWSATVGRRLLYVALPVPLAGSSAFDADSGGGVIRLAVDLEAVDRAAAGPRRELLVASAIGVIAAALLSVFISGLTVRPIAELREFVADLAKGRLDRRLRWSRDDEFGEIARSINQVVEQQQDQLEFATAERDQLELVLSSMVEGVLVIDPMNRIVLANPRAREVFGLTGEVDGRSPESLIRDDRIVKALSDAGLSREPIVREFELRGETPRTLVMTALRFARTGSPSGTVAVFGDITNIRRLEGMRSDFIANASHELRTPLTPIRGFAETLLASPDLAEANRAPLQSIARNASRMQALIDDLLALSRIETRDAALEATSVDLASLGRTLADDMAPRLAEKRIAIEVRADDDCLVHGDERGIEQLLSNLLENALRYTDEGGRIIFSASARQEVVEACVEDTGIGVPEADLPRIFERFYRVDKARSRAKGGTGLGLAIVKHWLQALGGTIQVESELGKGSRFRFTLPRANSR
jgi:two-component system phosphate regulon sensor histidine kinase PhoR